VFAVVAIGRRSVSPRLHVTEEVDL
jgi:hypothetical protein